MIDGPIRATIEASAATVGAAVGATIDAVGFGTPAIIAASVASAVAAIAVLRRLVSSQLGASRDTIDGLRAENARLRAQLTDNERGTP